jgi:predicted transcriptional regulator
MKTVAELLATKPNPFNFVEPDAKVIDALYLLNATNHSYLVVMHDQDYRGIFCERDFLRNVALRGWDPQTCNVEDVMTTGLPIVQPSDSVEHCMRLLNIHKTRYLPVFEHHHFLSVITVNDLLRCVLKNREEVFDFPGTTITSEVQFSRWISG